MKISFAGLVVFILAFAAAASADIQFGAYGLQSLTNHSELPNPAGFGVFLQKSLGTDVRLRVSTSIAYDSDDYLATIGRGWGLRPPGDTIRDLWHESSRMSIFELSIMGTPIDSRTVMVYVGGGAGLASFDWRIKGRNTGYEKSSDAGQRLSFSLIGDFEIIHPRLHPLVLHLWIRERITVGTLFQCEDCASLFDDSISSTELSLALAFRL